MDPEQCPVAQKVKDDCQSSCSKYNKEYVECTKRIEGKEGKSCEPYFREYLECIDKCTAPRLFKLLK